MEVVKVKKTTLGIFRKFQEAEDRLHDPLGFKKKLIYGFYFCGGFMLLIVLVMLLKLL